ncbi:MAG: hypothetical protein PHV33_12015 [Elusimicrobiales bacterium]|nr:hypothetical protein [Elusimicrobiales bacterium]
MDGFDLYSAAGLNSLEAAVWISIGLLLLAGAKKAAVNSSRKDLVALSVLFAAFGLSDVAEVYSGAWWRPWWLLLWKALNAAGLLYFAGKLYLAEKAEKKRIDRRACSRGNRLRP